MTSASFDRYCETKWLTKKEYSTLDQNNTKMNIDQSQTQYTSNLCNPQNKIEEKNNAIAPTIVPISILAEVQLRFLCPDDLQEVRALCRDWFPIGE